LVLSDTVRVDIPPCVSLPAFNMSSMDASGTGSLQVPSINSLPLPPSSTLGENAIESERMLNVEPLLPSTVGGIPSTAGKHQRERERRIMPARLRRVSNLLAGSTIEDELSGTNTKLGERKNASNGLHETRVWCAMCHYHDHARLTRRSFSTESYLLPPSMPLALNSFDKLEYNVIRTSLFDIEGDYFFEQDMRQSSKATQMIETPEFRTRDDTEMMGKTRKIRSEVSLMP
jgi:hypothetical protein